MTRLRRASARSLLPLLPALVLPLACERAAAPSAAPAPDVVLILVDALRADRLGAAGYPEPISPNIDSLASEGVLFTDAYSQATWTKPAMATLLTSLYPTEHGLVRLGAADPTGAFVTDRLPRATTTLAERFREAGYQTLAVVNQVHLQKKLGFAQGFDRFEWRRGKTAPELNEIFREMLAHRDRRPIFAWIHYLDVHWPYTNRLPDREAPDLGPTAIEHEPPQGLQWVADWQREHLDEATRAALERRYDHEVAFVDAAIGDLVESLRAGGRWRDTIVLVTADHGESFGAHGGLMHGHLPYEEELRVPLVFRLPDRPGRPAGRRSTPVGLIDVAPTLLDLAGVTAGPPPMRGRSLRPVIDGSEDPERPVFAQTAGGWSVRRGHLKLIALEDGSYRLFDLAADPGEQRNLAADECDAGCEALASLLRAFRASLKEPPGESSLGSFGEEDLEELRALGYL